MRPPPHTVHTVGTNEATITPITENTLTVGVFLIVPERYPYPSHMRPNQLVVPQSSKENSIGNPEVQYVSHMLGCGRKGVGVK